MVGLHRGGGLDEEPVMTVLNTHIYELYREPCSGDVILFLARSKLRQNPYCHETFQRKLSTCPLPCIYMGHNGSSQALSVCLGFGRSWR